MPQRYCLLSGFAFAAILMMGIRATAQTATVLPIEDQRSAMLVTADLEADVPRFRPKFYQGAELRGGYITDFSGRDGLSQTHEEARVSFGVPLFSLDNILAVSPYVRFDHLNGFDDGSFEIPSTLYNTGVTLLNRKQWSPRVSTFAMLTPSVRSDMSTSVNAFRVFGLGLVNWQATDAWSLSVGAVYLDRADLGVLPVLGATWTPVPWWKVDLTMPRPRISRRMWKQSSQAEAWTYLAAELGGNTWAVSRASGATDQLSLRSIELQVGYEVLRAGNRGWLVEGGYAFGRKLEYEDNPLARDLDDAIFFRGGWRF